MVDILDDATLETYYISKASGAYLFSHINIVPWTNWIGQAYVRAREESKLRKQMPSRLGYGPPQRFAERPLGPLVDYQFQDGVLRGFELFSPRAASVPAAAPTVERQEAFGLKEIIQSLDSHQDDQIRVPMQGIYIFMGGPGVGKTTVALHRIPYLIVEQHHRERPGDRDRPSVSFFTQETTLVVVWKEHLVPYLEQCLAELECNRVVVRHVDNWVEETLRSYVPIGPGAEGYRISADTDEIERAKLTLTEHDIEEFLSSDSLIDKRSRDRIAEVAGRVADSLGQTGINFRPSLPADRHPIHATRTPDGRRTYPSAIGARPAGYQDPRRPVPPKLGTQFEARSDPCAAAGRDGGRSLDPPVFTPQSRNGSGTTHACSRRSTSPRLGATEAHGSLRL